MPLKDFQLGNVLTVENKLTPQAVAEMFWEMNSEEMALFFNHLGTIADEEPVGDALYIQLLGTIKQRELNVSGVSVIETIAAIKTYMDERGNHA